MTKAVSPLHNLFKRQQPKVKYTQRKAALLNVYAQQNHRLYAELIKAWLEEKPSTNKNNRD